jgi:hypothetical protein
MTGAKAWTFEAWAKVDCIKPGVANVSDQTVIGVNSIGKRMSIHAVFRENATLHFCFYNGYNAGFGVKSKEHIEPGCWTHLALQYEPKQPPTGETGTVRIFWNGTLDAEGDELHPTGNVAYLCRSICKR